MKLLKEIKIELPKYVATQITEESFWFKMIIEIQTCKQIMQ